MAYFKFIAVYEQVEYGIYAVLAEDDGEAYFSMSDVSKMVRGDEDGPPRDGEWPRSRNIKNLEFFRRHNCDLYMIRLDHLF